MAGRGAPPKDEKHGRNVPVHNWNHAEGIGWQHGDIPEPPDGLLKRSGEVWETWFSSWFAAFWTPSDVPALEHVILLYDAVRRGEGQRSAELRLCMDTWGISPKGQQDRRWRPPAAEDSADERASKSKSSRYNHLRAVGDGG